jgi:hypothetical protein
MRMPVQIVTVRMEVIVDVEVLYAGNARMRINRPAHAADAHARQGEDAEQDEHDADGKFHRHGKPRRNDDPEHDDRTADRHDGDGVPDAPSGGDQRRPRHAALATDDCRNGDYVVGVGRMPHPQEEAEKKEGHDVQGSSSHCKSFKMAIPILSCVSPNANSHPPSAAFFENGEHAQAQRSERERMLQRASSEFARRMAIPSLLADWNHITFSLAVGGLVTSRPHQSLASSASEKDNFAQIT